MVSFVAFIYIFRFSEHNKGSKSKSFSKAVIDGVLTSDKVVIQPHQNLRGAPHTMPIRNLHRPLPNCYYWLSSPSLLAMGIITLLPLMMRCGRLAMTTLRRRGQCLVNYVPGVHYCMLTTRKQHKYTTVLAQLLAKPYFFWVIVNLG